MYVEPDEQCLHYVFYVAENIHVYDNVCRGSV